MQIVTTNKCNFTCDHCLYSCSPRKKDMLSDYALRVFLDNNQVDEEINICGGEIFLNPEWKEHLHTCACYASEMRIVTNGSLFYTKKGNKTKTLREFLEVLENIASRGVRVSVCISNDTFHQEQYYKKGLLPLGTVIKYFRWDLNDLDSDYLYYEEDTRARYGNKIFPLGRAITKGVYTCKPNCTIDDDEIKNGNIQELTLMPDYKVYACCNGFGYIGEGDDSNETLMENLTKLHWPEKRSCLHCGLKHYKN